jgi:hypothetical protein
MIKPAGPGARALAEAIIAMLKADADLQSAEALCPSYTGQYDIKDFSAEEQERWNRCADALYVAVTAVAVSGQSCVPSRVPVSHDVIAAALKPRLLLVDMRDVEVRVLAHFAHTITSILTGRTLGVCADALYRKYVGVAQADGIAPVARDGFDQALAGMVDLGIVHKSQREVGGMSDRLSEAHYFVR